jgi:hypothetical protein
VGEGRVLGGATYGGDGGTADGVAVGAGLISDIDSVASGSIIEAGVAEPGEVNVAAGPSVGADAAGVPELPQAIVTTATSARATEKIPGWNKRRSGSSRSRNGGRDSVTGVRMSGIVVAVSGVIVPVVMFVVVTGVIVLAVVVTGTITVVVS